MKTALAAALLATPLAAQVAPYGSSCDGLFPSSTITYAGSTTPGEGASIRIDGAPPGALAILHAGTEAIDLDVSGFDGVGPGCRLLVNPNVSYLLLPTDASGSLTIGFKVPGSLGSDLYLQWAVVEQVSPPSVSLGEALHVSLDTSPYVNPVLYAPSVVDYDEDGSASVLLDGSGSYTHELGHAIDGYLWRVDGEVVATSAVAKVPLAVGEHDVVLHVADDDAPPDTALATAVVTVHPSAAVPGVAVRLHDASGTPGGATALLDAPPATADWAEVVEAFALGAGDGTLGASPLSADVLAVLTGSVTLAAPADATWELVGGVDGRLFVDAAPVAPGVALPLGAGAHAVEARFAVDDLADTPLALHVGLDGAPPAPLVDAAPTHDATSLAPVLNAVVPAVGASSGGTTVTLTGQGFFPSDGVFVLWGDTTLGPDDGLVVSPDRIEFSAPPAPPGTISVAVVGTPGLSNARSFDYVDSGPVPSFSSVTTERVHLPTQVAWGPDGRLYVAGVDGSLRAVTFDDDWQAVSTDVYVGTSALPNHNMLALAFSPFDDAEPVRVYVSHGLLYGDGGTTVPFPSPYRGQVSVLTGPHFDTPEPLVTGLAQSNSGHAVNGLVFDDNGDLLILSGCNTNAGVADLDMGSLPESPLSGALLEAETSRPDFDGAVEYVFTETGLSSADQRDGELVDVAPGSHVHVRAPGLRNPYDLVHTTRGRLYATDNGPNLLFGPGSTGASSQTSFDPAFPDELLLLEPGRYYGSANRSRGRTDPRQLVYRGPDVPSLPGEFAQTLVTLPSSTDGIDEYRADTFGGQMRGELLVQQWNGGSRRLRLSDDGREVVGNQAFSAITTGLDIVGAPGGAVIVSDHSGSALRVLVPDEPGATGAAPMVVLDVFPWRAPASGGASFVLGGRGFGTLADTTVTFGGIPAALTSVSDTRIRGVVPAGTPSTELLDVDVASGGHADTLPDAFRFLFPLGTEPGRWEALAPLPTPLGDAATGVVDGIVYVVSPDAPAPLGYDVHARAWLDGLAPRPFVGAAHAVEVIGDKLYVLGGIGGGSAGRVQVYDPASDAWSLGTDMPWAGGAVATACVDGVIFAAGGRIGGVPTSDAARYDPLADAWTAVAPLPSPVAEAAAGTDGARLFVFGGVDTSGLPIADARVFDPGPGAWTTLAPLPVARGALGRAVLWEDELFVVGGHDGAGVTGRVDAYDVAADAWRDEAPMPTPRAGTSPVEFESRVFVPGGSDGAPSAAFETFRRP